MTREQFIKKWLANPDKKYTERFRDEMRDDLDKVINREKENRETIIKLPLRLLASPFILGLYAIFSLGRLIKAVYQFIRYGGESIVYSKDEPKKLNL